MRMCIVASVHMYAYAYMCVCIYVCVFFAVGVACTLEQVLWASAHCAAVCVIQMFF